jgi:hypothetical protein
MEPTQRLIKKVRTLLQSTQKNSTIATMSPDFTVIDEIDPLDINQDVREAIRHPPENDEVNRAINKSKPGTSTCAHGLTTDMSKALPPSGRAYIATIIRQDWIGEINPDEWHVMKLTMLYKGKGKQNDLNNWRGICLKEVVAKLVLLAVLDAANVSEQFATIGCQEAIYTLRAALGLRRLHGKEMCVLFVDLVKAYNTINHELLYRILDKYCIPSELIDVNSCMYANCELQITTGKEKRLIDY